MSNKIFLSLGDVIQVNAPDNLGIHDHIYLISYLDDQRIKLIDAASTGEPIQLELLIEDGKLSDESITEISILSHSPEKGFSRQHHLLPNTWIDLYFGGAVPAVLTGQIINLEEDMIEIETFPDKQKIFIDFAYKGIPANLPITKINIRESPIKDLSPSHEAEGDEALIEKDVSIFTGDELQALIKEGDEIIFGEEEEMIQVVEVPEDEKRFGISQQSEDLLDELLANIPTNERTNRVLNNIHLMIERFKQLRNTYSEFDEYGNPERPFIKGDIYKPLLENLYKLKKQLFWIVPIVKNKKKLYDIVDDDFEDIISLSLGEVREEVYDLMEKFKRNRIPGDENKYDTFFNSLYPFLQPFIASQSENLLINKAVEQNYNTLVNNLEAFESTVFGVEPFETPSSKNPAVTHNMQFVMDRYIQGLSKLIGSDKRDKNNIKRVPLTPNDIMNIQSFLLFSPDVVRYSNLYLPSSSILEKVQLHTARMYYFELLNNHIHVKNVQENNSFLRHPSVFTNDSVQDPSDEKYRDFLNEMVPTTKKIFHLYKKHIDNPTSYMSIVNQLEPFSIYDNDITYKSYEEIVEFMDKEITEWIKAFIINKQQMERYQTIKYNVDFTGNHSILFPSQELRTQIMNIYHFPEGYIPTDETIIKMLQLDGARIFTLLLSLNDVHLHGQADMDQEVEAQLERTNKALESGEKENVCQEYILAKRYLAMDEIESDNDKVIYFDKQYDITRYGLVDEFKEKRAELSPEEFKSFLNAHLKGRIGMNDGDASREVEALLLGKRHVAEGDYAMLYLEGEGEFKYFRREGTRWVLDQQLNNKNWTEIFCNLQKKCLNVQGDCNDMDINRALIEKKLLAEILSNFSDQMNLSRERLETLLRTNIDFYKKRLLSLLILDKQKETRYDVQQIQIAATYEYRDIVQSPLAPIRDMILAQQDFPKKQQMINKFIARFCRIGGENENESPYWYYDAELSLPLIPTFYKLLADAFEENRYQEVLQQVVRDRGRLSDAGDTIVDKHSGYEIRKIDYVVLEEYDEKGFRMLSRELLEADESKEVANFEEVKKYNSPESTMIANVINAMGRFLSVPLDSQTEFIIKEVRETLSRIIPSKATYDKKKAQAAKRKKKMDSYERIKNNALLTLTLGYIILCIQTMIPPPRIKKTFPGCKRSFKGFPFDGNSNLNFLNYVACIIYTIKLEGEPWKGIKMRRKKGVSRDELKRMSINSLVSTLEKFLTKHILIKPEVKEKINAKREFLAAQTTKNEIAEDHNIMAWTTFLPPLHLIRISNIQNVTPSFVNNLLESLKKGRWEQFEQLSLVRGKIILYSLSIQETIQRIINKSVPILKNSIDEPFLQNVCCNVGPQTAIKYFTEKNPSIDTHNAIVIQLSSIIENIRNVSMAPYLYDPRNTKLVYPAVLDRFTEKTIYKAFIRYCRFNSGVPLDETLQAICIDNKSEFLFTDTFEEKLRILKQEGKRYTLPQFYRLLLVVERKNIVPIDFNLHIVSARTRLESLLDHFQHRDIQHPLFAFYRETLDYVDIQEDEKQNVMDQMETYLSLAIPELRDKIFAFIRDNSNITGTKLQKIKTILEHLGNWYPRGDGIYMTSDDETHLFSANFFKNNILNLGRIYPSIILDKVNYKNVNISNHWNFSIRHQGDLSKIIAAEFEGLRQFYENPHLIGILRNVRETTKNILRIIDVIPFFARTRDANILFGGEMFNNLMLFYYLSTLQIYIIPSDDIAITTKESRRTQTMREVDLASGKIELVNESVANLVSQLILTFGNHKKTINLNNDMIREKSLKSREREKNKMTSELGLLAPAEREVEDLLKTHKLGRWSIGLTKALFEYDQGQYDKEQREIERDAAVERELTQMGVATDMNENILRMDVQVEQEARENSWREAYDISDLPEDDDYGDRDGDEGF